MQKVCVSEELHSEGQSVWLTAPLELTSEIEPGVDPGLTASQCVTELEPKIVQFYYTKYLAHLRVC